MAFVCAKTLMRSAFIRLNVIDEDPVGYDDLPMFMMFRRANGATIAADDFCDVTVELNKLLMRKSGGQRATTTVTICALDLVGQHKKKIKKKKLTCTH